MTNNIIKYLAEAGQRAPSADNSQPWIFALENQSIRLFIDLEKIKPSCFDANHPAILLALGAVIENILQAANWVGVECAYEYCLDLKTGHCATFHVPENHKKLPNNAKDHPLFTRHTNRLPFVKRPIQENILNEIVALSNSKSQILLFQDDEQINHWSQWVRTASEVRFQTPDIHDWFGQSLKFTHEEVSSNEGLDVNTFGLPLTGKLILKATQTWSRMRLLNKLGAYKLIAKLESENLKGSPALIAIIALLDNDTAIETGRLMERVWIKLNAAGLSVQPYFVISDQLYRLKQQKIAPQFIGTLDGLDNKLQAKIKNGFLYMLLRVGYSEKQPIRSLRRQVK
jgi:hypothetical protein